MIPNTISATSLQVAGLCLARWEVEYLDKTPGFGGVAANIGSTVHLGQERFVQLCYIDKTHEPSEQLLVDLYKIAYIEVFQSADMETPEFKDGLALTKKWYKRTSFLNRSVLSVEVKEHIMVPFFHPDEKDHEPCEFCTDSGLERGTCQRPLNYVIDRLDQIGDTEYEVVDYKTVRVPISPDDLHQKIQARIYALAVQIKYPNATRIKVTFDLLRHERVSVIVTRDDNINTWHWLLGELKRIVDSPPSPPPTLNMECGYCVMKATCPLLRKNIEGGGVHSLTIEEAAQLKADIDAQARGQEYLLAELDDILMREAYERDSLEYDAGDYVVEVKAQRRRAVHPPDVADVLGPDLFAKLGKINIGTLDDLLKGDEITPQQKEQIRSLISQGLGDPHAKVKRKQNGL